MQYDAQAGQRGSMSACLKSQVLPDLLSKHEAVDVFMECEEENDADEQAEAMLLPAFMETLAMVSRDSVFLISGVAGVCDPGVHVPAGN